MVSAVRIFSYRADPLDRVRIEGVAIRMTNRSNSFIVKIE